MKKPVNVSEYIAAYPPEVQHALEQVRSAVARAAPQAVEVISYGMPAFKQEGILVWFGAHTHHIGFYPGASGVAAFQEQLRGYKTARGSVQFPLDKRMPLGLITKMVKFRLSENEMRRKGKK